MIFGIGFDAIEIDRIAHTLSRFGMRFINRCFTPLEWQLAHKRKNTAATLAKRFAAKEACAKALLTGLHQGVTWQSIEIIKNPSGDVTISLTHGAKKALERLIPPGFKPQIHLSLSDNTTNAFAQVIISGVPEDPIR